MATVSATPESVFREYAPRIYAIARRMLSHDADAEDVTSEVLMQVVRKLDTFRGEAALPTWLHQVTVHAALAARAKRAQRHSHETPTGDTPPDELIPDRPHDPWKFPRPWDVPADARVLAAERQAIIEAAITQLPEIYRDVFILADLEGLPNARIGEILNLELAAVKSRLHRARLRLRDALAPHFEESYR
ncbi:MAG: RNA polymerase sigma factor [Gemmataceae bacterium]